MFNGFCVNSKCKHYFEDCCMIYYDEDVENPEMQIGNEICEKFEKGMHKAYEETRIVK